MSKEKKERNKEIIKKKKEGMSFRKIAEIFNISVCRVFQIWEEYQEKYNV